MCLCVGVRACVCACIEGSGDMGGRGTSIEDVSDVEESERTRWYSGKTT